tara:strand:- start:105 stop:209 length:105 start_codon:yes stop_codon:yes gene_type:complete
VRALALELVPEQALVQVPAQALVLGRLQQALALT